MKQMTLVYIVFFMVVAAIFSCVMPYPIFSNYTNITESNAYDINNYFETELSSQSTTTPQILDLNWFDNINTLLSANRTYEIFDIKSGQSFFVSRTGGTNHAEVEPISENDNQTIYEIFNNNWDWQRLPVLLKYNSLSYIPASLSGYPHGYSKTTSNKTNGHFCLHFKNSKTHVTNKIDSKHQKCVNYATQQGEKFLKQL